MALTARRGTPSILSTRYYQSARAGDDSEPLESAARRTWVLHGLLVDSKRALWVPGSGMECEQGFGLRGAGTDKGGHSLEACLGRGGHRSI